LLEEQGPGAAPPVPGLVPPVPGLVPPEAFHEVGQRTERRWTKVEVRRVPGTARLLVEVRREQPAKEADVCLAMSR
jgi:hypothetical protein